MQAPKAEARGYTWLIVQSLSPRRTLQSGGGFLPPSLSNHSWGSSELKPLDINATSARRLSGRSLWTSLRTRHARCSQAHSDGMGYPSCLHTSGILSRRLPKLSPIDYDQCEIIEELYREILGAEDRGTLQNCLSVNPSCALASTN